MQKSALLVLLIAGLAGCASTPAPAPYGNFVQAPVATDDKAMADDVVKKLAALYPPAKTRFNLQHSTPDAFGIAMVETMRAKGCVIGNSLCKSQLWPRTDGPSMLAARTPP